MQKAIEDDVCKREDLFVVLTVDLQQFKSQNEGLKTIEDELSKLQMDYIDLCLVVLD